MMDLSYIEQSLSVLQFLAIFPLQCLDSEIYERHCTNYESPPFFYLMNVV